MEEEKLQLQELRQFLQPSFQTEIKGVALDYIAGLTASEKGCNLITGTDQLVSSIIHLLIEDTNEEVKSSCLKILINILSDPENAKQLGLLDKDFLYFLFIYVLHQESRYADDAAMLLTNISRCEKNCKVLLTYFESVKNVSLPDFVDAFCIMKFNKKDNQLSHVGSFLSNMTLLEQARKLFLDKDRCVLQRLLPYTTHKESKIRRAAAARIIKNVSFETEYHEWLLGSDIDLLSHLLLPLAGPEELLEDEMNQLPIDLQYLPEDKEREPDPEIRLLLIETLLQLCTRKHGREKLRNNGAYVVMRELHKIEQNGSVAVAVEKLIHILIGDEPADHMENLKNVEIPEDIKAKFDEIDAKEDVERGT